MDVESSPVLKEEELLKCIPNEYLQPSYYKAGRALVNCLFLLVLGYLLLIFLPWFALPLGWLIVGTSVTGLMAVAYDCKKQKFVRHKLINEIVGCLCLTPVWTPFVSWREDKNQKTRVANSAFWYFSSYWQQVKTNVDLISSSMFKLKGTYILNFFLLYLFVCLFFPIMTMTVGVWGLFKYYFIPLAIYHFWISTQLKLNGSVLDGNFSVISYPSWVEFLGNNFNNTSLNLPSYNFKAAKKSLQEKWGKSCEISFSVGTLFSFQNKPKTVSNSKPSVKKQKTGKIKTDRKIFKIHGKFYDVSNFQHPGGPVSLGLGLSRDATALFEAHHPFVSRAKLESLLSKYRIDQTEEQSEIMSKEYLIDEKEVVNEVFHWDQYSLSYPPENPEKDTFTSELRREVKNYFDGEAKRRGVSFNQAIKATIPRYFEVIIPFVCLVSTIPFFVQGYYITIFLIPTFAWLFAVNLVHDATHFAWSTNWFVNAVLGHLAPQSLTPFIWYHQHVIAHHSYPNVEFRDPDIAHAPAFLRVHPSIKWKPAHRYQKLTNAVIWTIGAALYLTVVPLKALAMGSLNRSVVLSPHTTFFRKVLHIFGSLVCSWNIMGMAMVCFQWRLSQNLLFTVFPWVIHSLYYMLATQINHLTDENMPRQGYKNLNFYDHQVLVSHSFCTGNKFVFLLTGGLNVQIEHHLFPTVNHCHLLEIQPIVIRLCKKYGIPYHASPSLWNAVGKYYNHIDKLSFSHLE